MFSLTLNSVYESNANQEEIIQDESSNELEETTPKITSWWTNVSKRTRKQPLRYNSQALDKYAAQKYKSYYPIKENSVGATNSRKDKPKLKTPEESYLTTSGKTKLQFSTCL